MTAQHTRKPTGFVATCQCGRAIGALDLERSRREDTARLLGQWLMRGCTVAPRFTSRWSAQIEQCECSAEQSPRQVSGPSQAQGDCPMAPASERSEPDEKDTTTGVL